MIFYICWTMVRLFIYKIIKCKKNKIWFNSLIDRCSKQCMRSHKYQRIKTYYLHIVSGLCMVYWWWIDRILYYYIYQLNGKSIVRWWFENVVFVWRILKLLLIIEVDQLLVTCKTVDRLMLSVWDKVSGQDKNVAAEKDQK